MNGRRHSSTLRRNTHHGRTLVALAFVLLSSAKGLAGPSQPSLPARGPGQSPASAPAKVLPVLSREQLADAIEAHQKGLSRIHVEYQLAHGTLAEGAGLPTFVAKEPRFQQEMTYAGDKRRSLEFFRFEWVTEDGQPHIGAFFFDGKAGAAVTVLPGSTTPLARITASRPRELAEEMTSRCRPDQCTYWPKVDRNLAEIIRSARFIRIEPAEHAGVPVYRVAVQVETDETITHEGREVKGHTWRPQRFWLRPDRCYLPVQIEECVQDPNMEVFDTKAMATRILSDFREVVPGVWMPFEVLWFSKPIDAPARATQARILMVAVGDAAEVPEQWEFPADTQVTDEIRGVRYTAGQPSRVRWWRGRAGRPSAESQPAGQAKPASSRYAEEGVR